MQLLPLPLICLLILLGTPFLLAFSPPQNQGRSHTVIPRIKHATTTSTSQETSSSTLLQAISNPPPPPKFRPKPLPVILGGGLFLFMGNQGRTPQDRLLTETLLQQAQDAMRQDPTITMELGCGIETGGVYASQKTNNGSYDQLVLQFQIEGGNAWAQGVAYGVRSRSSSSRGEIIQLVTLEVANMDASINGTPFEVPIQMALGEAKEEASTSAANTDGSNDL